MPNESCGGTKIAIEPMSTESLIIDDYIACVGEEAEVKVCAIVLGFFLFWTCYPTIN
jgi:hypothetical protein